MAGSQQILYVYKVVADTGGAPCISRGMLSLAICKPKIRRTARKGDLVFGFGGKAYGERLLYIAEVTEKPEVGGYYQAPRFAARPDCIYKDKNGVPERKPSARYHAETDERQKDVGMRFENAFVLLSENFRYFGRKGTIDYKRDFPAIKTVVESLRRGHRVNHSSQLRDELIKLKELVWSKHRTMILGSPIEHDLTQLCNRGTPSLQSG
jgi:hypothetical protein